ncbi:VCBS repeat-containing protein [Zobellia sp.]|nr:VCBS repeat-containing protein [Zobellia sp.]
MKNLLIVSLILLLALSACEEKETSLFSRVDSGHSNVTFNNSIVETDSFNILTTEYIYNGSGVAIGDFNNDSKPDLFFTGNQVSNRLYLNQDDFKFKDISEQADIEAPNSWKTGVAVADINSDGLLDIYICAAMYDSAEQKANLLFVNQGNDKNGEPTFKEMGKAYGIADSGNSMNATFFDYNKDGLLDLYVLNNVDIHELPSNYREKITDGTALSNDRLYRNNGDNTFTNVTIEAGITIEGYGLGLAIADLNYDGWPDIYVSNDYLTNDILYFNNGDGTFSNNIDSVVKHQSKFSMGSDISDYNNDGFLDIVTLDMLGETNYRLKTTVRGSKYNDYNLNEKFGYAYQQMRNMLQMGQGVGVPYSEIGLMAGISRTDWSWSPLFADVNNDGGKDLLITNGFPRDITDLDFGEFNFNVQRFLSPSQILDSIPVVKTPNYAYKNTNNGLFTDAGDEWGLNVPSFSNGAAFVDLDSDGDLDYVVNNINDEAFIFKNNLDQKNSKEHNYLTVKLKGPKTNISGIGAKIVVRFDDDTFQYQEHYLTRGYMSSVQDIAHFGLANKETIGALEVVWPDGKYQKLENIKGNQIVELNYKDAKTIDANSLTFPLVQKENPTIFNEVTQNIGIDYIHQEKDKVDYNVQRTLPHKLTQNGPCLATGDINGDGTEDFIVGSSSGYSPVVFLQNKEGDFTNSQLFSDEENMKFEEEGIALFDLENDGDLDLYLVSGSNEFEKESPFYSDRLLLNDGKGNFTIATNNMPEIKSSGSVVKVHDFDGDGYTDLFVGGRTPFAEYPKPAKSFLLKNDAGILKDVTDDYCSELANAGMLTDAVWADLDKDGLKDLVITGEFMPVTVFKNKKTGLSKLTNTGLDSLSGWWESIVAHDFDKDGDLDLVIGNLGANNLYQPSADRPVTLLSKDFDNNGTVDPVMFAYIKDNYDDETYESYPVNFWGDLSAQSPLFRSKFNYYREYANTTQSDLFKPEEMDGVIEMTVNYDKTTYFENTGDGSFKHHELPLQTQVAPINRILTADVDGDDNSDLLMIGNNYGNEVFVGRYDAFNGGVLKGDGHGGFNFVNTLKSGFNVTGDAKDMVSVKNANGGNPYIIVTQNRGALKIYQKN